MNTNKRLDKVRQQIHTEKMTLYLGRQYIGKWASDC